MTRELLDAELIRDEGERLYLYDDADGTPIKAGTTVKGIPTCGVGCNLTFLYPEESRWLFHNRLDRALADLTRSIGWFESLDDVRQRALANLYFNVPVFLRWPRFMDFANKRDWLNAANELENTHPWIDQVGSRGHRIAAMLRTGKAGDL